MLRCLKWIPGRGGTSSLIDAVDRTLRFISSINVRWRVRLLNGFDPGSVCCMLVIVARLRSGRKWGNPEVADHSCFAVLAG
jgi:hypothetical protein